MTKFFEAFSFSRQASSLVTKPMENAGKEKLLIFCDPIAPENWDENLRQEACCAVEQAILAELRSIPCISEEDLTRALQAAHAALKAFSKDKGDCLCSCLILVPQEEGSILLAGVGDGRIYQVSEDGARLCFFDPKNIVDLRPHLSPAERKIELKNVLGVSDKIHVHMRSLSPQRYSRLVLLNYGLFNQSSKNEIAQFGMDPMNPESGLKACLAAKEDQGHPLAASVLLANAERIEESSTAMPSHQFPGLPARRKRRTTTLALAGFSCCMLFFMAFQFLIAGGTQGNSPKGLAVEERANGAEVRRLQKKLIEQEKLVKVLEENYEILQGELEGEEGPLATLKEANQNLMGQLQTACRDREALAEALEIRKSELSKAQNLLKDVQEGELAARELRKDRDALEEKLFKLTGIYEKQRKRLDFLESKASDDNGFQKELSQKFEQLAGAFDEQAKDLEVTQHELKKKEAVEEKLIQKCKDLFTAYEEQGQELEALRHLEGTDSQLRQDLAKLQQDHQDLQEKAELMEMNLALLEAERDEMTKKFIHISNDRQTWEEELAHLEDEKEDILAEKQKGDRQLRDLMEANGNLKNEISRLAPIELEYQELSNQLTILEASQRDLSQNFASAVKLNAEYRQETDQTVERINKLLVALQEKEEVEDSLQRSLEEAQGKLSLLEPEAVQLRELLSKGEIDNKKLESQVIQLQEKCELQEASLSTLVNTKNELESDVLASKEQIEGLLTANQRREQRIHELEASCADGKSKVAEIQALIQTQNQKLAAMEKEYGSMNGQMQESLSKAEYLQEALTESREGEAALKVALTNLQSEKAILEKELNSQIKSRESLATNLKEKKQRVDALEHFQVAYQGERDARLACEQDMRRLISRIHELESHMTAQEESKRLMAKEFEALEANRYELLGALKELQARVVPSPAQPESIERYHIVSQGETLSDIALQYYQDPNSWRKLYEANSHLIVDANRIRVGTALKIPEKG